MLFAAPLLAVLALGGCERGKPRHPPPDPMAVAPPQAQAPPPPAEGMSAGLAKRKELAGFSIDSIGLAQDPLNRQPAATPQGEPIVIQGFGFDPTARLPGRGVDVVVDGKAYRADYGAGRADVAAYFKTPRLTPTGFKVTLPADTLAAGAHQASVRVVAADGRGYFEGLRIAFVVQERGAALAGPPH